MTKGRLGTSVPHSGQEGESRSNGGFEESEEESVDHSGGEVGASHHGYNATASEKKDRWKDRVGRERERESRVSCRRSDDEGEYHKREVTHTPQRMQVPPRT